LNVGRRLHILEHRWHMLRILHVSNQVSAAHLEWITASQCNAIQGTIQKMSCPWVQCDNYCFISHSFLQCKPSPQTRFLANSSHEEDRVGTFSFGAHYMLRTVQRRRCKRMCPLCRIERADRNAEQLQGIYDPWDAKRPDQRERAELGRLKLPYPDVPFPRACWFLASIFPLM
jgi:hypothetical protein